MVQLLSASGKKTYGINEYAVDTYEEIAQIPQSCGMGSTVLVISEKTVYVKNGAGKWVAL